MKNLDNKFKFRALLGLATASMTVLALTQVAAASNTGSSHEVVALCTTQDGPPPQERGPRRPPMGPALAGIPEVAKELGLTEDQLAAIRDVAESLRGSRPDKETMDAAMGKIKSIMNAAQWKRFNQIQLQLAGPGAFLMPETVQALGLSSAQQDQIKAILDANRPKEGERPQGDPKQMHDKVMKQILAVLTADQQAKWQDMLGAEFKLPKRGPGGGPGGPGGPEGRGGPGGPGGPDGRGGPGGPGEPE